MCGGASWPDFVAGGAAVPTENKTRKVTYIAPELGLGLELGVGLRFPSCRVSVDGTRVVRERKGAVIGSAIPCRNRSTHKENPQAGQGQDDLCMSLLCYKLYVSCLDGYAGRSVRSLLNVEWTI